MDSEPYPMIRIGISKSDYWIAKMEAVEFEREYWKLRIEMLKEERSKKEARGIDNGTK